MIDFNKENSFVKLKDYSWLEKQRVAGKIAAETLILLKKQVEEKTTKSLIELNGLAEDFIIKSGAIPTFKGYKGFPSGVCISVNKQLVHGIPTDYILKDGDVVSFDLGATYQGAIADTALTCIFGDPISKDHVKLIDVCKQSLYSGIKAIAVGKKLGVIGNAIYKYSKNNNFNVVYSYGGHGIGNSPEGDPVPHAPPFVSNKSSVDEGIRIQPGLVIAIEPMICIGDTSTTIDTDGWTVNTGSIGAHMEHSVFIHNDHVEIVTHNESDSIDKQIYFS